MAYCMRYHPAYAKARDALQAGRIGRVLYARAWFESYLPDWHPWEDFRQSYAARRDLGGGVLPTLDHDFDYFNWCFGSPRNVTGFAANTGALGIEVDDWASVSLRYDNGPLATLLMSFSRRDRRRGFEFIGDQGALRFDMEQGQLLLIPGGTAETELLWDGRQYDLNDMYFDLLADFVSAVASRAGREAPVPLSAGLDTLAIVSQVRSLSDD
jgi:predicted dehydrogenase